ncbi:dachshund homolog 1-like [Nematostella vectensis]|nr:dachshund homolog 1-like [Nematostella vectensis]
MESPTAVYSPPPHHPQTPQTSDYSFIEHDTPSLPLGKEYKLKTVTVNGIDIAAFNVDGEDLLCFPQVYEYFLKDLVSGMHTVYTKLKRMNIQGRNCNVEQVRMMRSVGAIGQVVNRCKLISKEDFNKIYEDCILYRGPGRRKKNPDIPPELMNYPFKHFKVDPERQPSDHISMETGDVKSTNHASKDDTRDNNNNGESVTPFKMPLSQHVTSPRYHGNTHVSSLTSRNSTSPVMNGTGTGSRGSPSGNPLSFSFSARPSSLSNLPTMVNIRGHMPHPNPSPALSLSSQGARSPVIQPTHSPVRCSSGGDLVIVEPSVQHVSSTGTMEHAEQRVTSDAGSDTSIRIMSREMEAREGGSIETLLRNIQGLLNVAAENARQQQRQALTEKEELRRQLMREREALQRSERLCASLQRGKTFLQKKLKREKKAKRKLNEKFVEEQQRCVMLQQEMSGTSQEAMKQLNESLIEELDRERAGKDEAERKLKEARGEIQNFMQNFLENPTTVQPQPPRDEIIIEQEHNVKEEQLMNIN